MSLGSEMRSGREKEWERQQESETVRDKKCERDDE